MLIAARAALAGGIGLLLWHSPGQSSGFALPEVSAAGIGTANALVANPEEAGAFAYNAAAMGFHDRSSLAVGALFIGPSFSVDTDRSHDSQGADWIAAPMIQAALKLNENWRIGLGINAPFGLETRWAFGTFPALSQPISTRIPGLSLPAGLDHPTQSELEVLALVPTATFKVKDNLSLSAGIDYYDARQATLNTAVNGLEGDGDGWGWNLGLLYRPGPLSLGASFHSAATLGVEGDVTTTNSVLIGLGTPSSQGAEVDLDLPWRLQLGARYEVNDRLAVELDWSRTGWSEFDELRIRSKTTGEILKTDRNAWEDASAYRLGATYRVSPRTLLRFGYTYDETGQPDQYFSARIPDSDRHLFALGVGHDLGQGWAIDAGYLYVRFRERSYRGAKTYVPRQDVNGTDAVDGDYEAQAHLVGLEVRKTF